MSSVPFVWDRLKPTVKLSDAHVVLVREIGENFLTTGAGVSDHRKRVELGKNRRLLDELVQARFLTNISNKYYPAFPSLYYMDPNLRDSWMGVVDSVFRAFRNLYMKNGAKSYSLQQVRDEANSLVSKPLSEKAVRAGMLFIQSFPNYFSNLEFSDDGPVVGAYVSENILDFENLRQAWEEELKLRPPAEINSTQSVSLNASEASKMTQSESVREFLDYDIFPQARMSKEVEDFLIWSIFLRRNSPQEYTLTFLSVLAAFLVAGDPLSIWFQHYTDETGIPITAIWNQTGVGTRDVLNTIPPLRQYEELLEIYKQRGAASVTTSMKSLFREAQQIKHRISSDSEEPVGLRHIMGAYIYRPIDHEKQLQEWGFRREDWSEAFITYLMQDFQGESAKWVILHTEVFGGVPKLPREIVGRGHIRVDEQDVLDDRAGEKQSSFKSVPGPSTHVARDRWTTDDSLGHFPYAYAIYRFLTDSATQAPLAISIQAPWGGGKSSLMRMIQAQLDPIAAKGAELAISQDSGVAETATVKDVLSELDLTSNKVKNTSAKQGVPKKDEKRFTVPLMEGGDRRRVTIWFNAWKYDSTSQVWAGLADCIVQQIGERLGPVERELFWLRLHLRRVDVAKIRRKVYDEILAQFLEKLTPRLWMYIVGATLAIVTFGSAKLNQLAWWHENRWLGVAGLTFAELLALVRQFTNAKSEVDNKSARLSLGEIVQAPDYRANLGFVHEVAEDLKKVFEIIPKKHLPMIVFIDDLDRCSPGKVAEVVEAINLFLAGEFPDCMFVLGIDDEMVAAALDKAHGEVIAKLPGYARSASIGWRFMDKFVQLPFIVPPASPIELTKYTESLLSEDGEGADVDIETRDRAAQVVELGQDETTTPELVIKQVAERHLLTSNQKVALKKDVEIIQGMSRNISQFSDQERTIRGLILAGAKEYSSNPRDIKRFVNLFRFHYFLRAAREGRKESVPSLKQMCDWIMLSLRWPEVVRWLRWHASRQKSSAGASLAALERQGAKCKDLAGWQEAVAKELLLKTDQAPWLSDEGFMRFFQSQASLPDRERLSACAEMGLW